MSTLADLMLRFGYWLFGPKIGKQDPLPEDWRAINLDDMGNWRIIMPRTKC